MYMCGFFYLKLPVYQTLIMLTKQHKSDNLHNFRYLETGKIFVVHSENWMSQILVSYLFPSSALFLNLPMSCWTRKKYTKSWASLTRTWVEKYLTTNLLMKHLNQKVADKRHLGSQLIYKESSCMWYCVDCDILWMW